jgi:hypothetical protein
MVALALYFLSKSNGNPDWFDLYKVYEIVRENTGMPWMQTRQPGGQTEEFTKSANHQGISGTGARHATMRGQPKGGMTLATAKALMTALTVAWIWVTEWSAGQVGPTL